MVRVLFAALVRGLGKVERGMAGCIQQCPELKPIFDSDVLDDEVQLLIVK